MKRILNLLKKNLLAVLLAVFFPGWAAAQTFTPTATSTPNCCQAATGWSNPTTSSSGGAGVAVDMTRDRIYIPDRGTGDIKAVDYTGALVTAFGTGGVVSAINAFNVAMGSCDNDGIYIAQRTPGTVAKLSATGSVIWTSGALSVGAIRAVYVDSSGTVYASDDPGNVFVLDNTGTLKNTLTGYGLSAPTGFVKIGSTLYIADSSNNRIVSLPQTGTYTYGTLSVVVPGFASAPYGIAMDLAGNFYVAGSGNDVFVYNNAWSLITSCTNSPGAFGIAVDETGAIYVAGQFGPTTLAKTQACITQPALGVCATDTPTPSYKGSNPPGSGTCFIYPSPARGDHATVTYNMASSGKVDLKLWNESAQLVADVSDQKPAGLQTTAVSLSGFASGVYFFQLTLTYDSGSSEKIRPGKFAVIH